MLYNMSFLLAYNRRRHLGLIEIAKLVTMNLNGFQYRLLIFKKKIFSGIFCMLLGLSTAHAEWHGEVGVLSNYVYRGYSKSQGDPVFQGHLDYQNDNGWFTGLGLSQVNFESLRRSNLATVEIKPYVGWAMPLSSNLRTELSVSGYIYNGNIFGQAGDYAELNTALHYQDWLSAKVSVAPNAYQRHVTIPNYELIYRRDILDTVRFSGGLGYYQAKGLIDQNFFYWNLGVSWFLTSYLALDIRYVDANVKEHFDTDLDHDEFYPRPLTNKYLLSLTVGF